MLTVSMHDNIMGGCNLIVEVASQRVHIASYANRWNAKRAVHTGAIIRRACRVDHESVAYALAKAASR